jgi:hypothetical protein
VSQTIQVSKMDGTILWKKTLSFCIGEEEFATDYTFIEGGTGNDSIYILFLSKFMSF